jgi:hypothetical protein
MGQVVRVGPLPDRAIEAAAEFHASVVPEILAQLNPTRNGEGTHAEHGRGVPSAERDVAASPPVPLPHPAGGPPLPLGEDIALVFQPAPYDHRAWRLAAIQDFARQAAPRRVNGVVGESEQAIAATLAWLEQAPGVTGQLLSVQTG